ncbi:MAG: hypothetical protein OXC70_09695 [Gammaproteobacteria bacterium]|nr:hypothetical protein [Gammaproteobacteria bacterium]
MLTWLSAPFSDTAAAAAVNPPLPYDRDREHSGDGPEQADRHEGIREKRLYRTEVMRRQTKQQDCPE